MRRAILARDATLSLCLRSQGYKPPSLFESPRKFVVENPQALDTGLSQSPNVSTLNEVEELIEEESSGWDIHIKRLRCGPNVENHQNPNASTKLSKPFPI
ncbi:hypothetical protein DVH24_023018 [Malus domestica]|uniref:Uncharacterized protein n=1 Tax=Malus domestica TaxID=3750 RepID=A0A498KQX9_MALDO|nr:hypothetical protein DVH24_023018 [Malus domestica]